MEENKRVPVHNNTCTAVPVGKGTVLLVTSCGIPSRITSLTITQYHIIPGTYGIYVCTPEKKSLKKGKNERKRERKQKKIKGVYTCDAC